MDDWEKLYDIPLPEKEDFYSHLSMEDNTDADYTHTKGAFKNCKITILCEYHDLFVQRNTLLLADVFENFRNTCLEIYEIDRAHFLTAPGLS